MTRKQKKMLVRILAASILLIALLAVQHTVGKNLPSMLLFVLYLIPYLVIGYDILRDALWGVFHGQLLDENFLMAVATVGAMALGLCGRGDYTEGISVMLFYQIGEWFQSWAVGKSRKSIRELMDIRPDHAWLETEEGIVETDPAEVTVGSVIVVKPGEKMPLDGVILDGSSTLDTAALTGESLPREVGQGDEIVSGCVNMTGLLKLRTTKTFGESTVAKILDLVENASSRKSRSEDFITKFARVYTPTVCGGALVLAILPPLVRMLLMGLTPEWGEWVYRALTFLVISCPCALVVSIPLSFFAGIGGASRAGILVKGSNCLETLAHIDTIVMDKTGTLTEGVFAVTDIVPVEGTTESELLALAALTEIVSMHPVSQSLRREYSERGGNMARENVRDIHEISGRGVTAKVRREEKEFTVAAGNEKLMAELGVKIPQPQESCGGTVIHVSADDVYLGRIMIADRIKTTAFEAMAKLKKEGVRRTVLLTGDAKAVAEKVGRALGVDEIYAELLPGDKVEHVEKLESRLPKKKKLAFVGDGMNDAPVLSRADIGIAMGAMGSDAAIEAADVVLMDDDPRRISTAIALSRRCLGIVYQNIVFAIGVKLVCLLLGALGYANMGVAIFADVGVMVLAVCNAIRALYVKK